MAREGLRYELSGAFATALRSKEPVTLKAVKVGSNGISQTINLTVQPVAEPKSLRGTMMVVFSEVAVAPEGPPSTRAVKTRVNARVAELEPEWQHAREEVQTTREEMQTSQEELKSTNEELQSKVDEVSRSNNDMTNLLNSTDIATLFLDGELRVRRFSTPTTKLFNLIPTDTGRPITNITTELVYPNLPEDARDVLRTLIFREQQIA